MSSLDPEAARQLALERRLAALDLDRRGFFRVFPALEAPITFQADQSAFAVRNISLGGFAFHAPDPPGPGWRLEGGLRLPGFDQPLAVSALVVESRPQSLVRCQFEDIRDGDLRRLAMYVRQRQEEMERLFAVEDDDLAAGHV